MGRKCILLLSVFVAALAAIHFLPFYPELKPLEVHFQPSPLLVGPLAPNNLLDSSEKLWGHIHGPESVEMHNGYAYAGTVDGNVHRLKGNIDEILIDRKCDDLANCNRPLGVRFFNQTQDLYVVDAKLGVYKVNVPSKKVETLFDASKPVEGVYARFPDDMTVSSSGDVYFTDFSTLWDFHSLHLCAMELRPDGRILHYNPATKTTKVLVDGLYTPNGIELSPKEDFIVFTETIFFRLRRYYVKGPKKGTLEIFADNVPGFPDNVRASGRGTYWLALHTARFGGKPTIVDYLAPYPQLRAYVTRLPYFFILPLKFLDSYSITNGCYDKAKLGIGNFMLSFAAGETYRLIVELDQNGKIIRSLHSSSNKIPSITQVTEYKGSLYLGTVQEKGIWKVKLN